MSSFNWGDLKQAAEDAGFSIVPAGTYDVLVKTAKAAKTQNGKDKINVQFTVQGGPNNGSSLFNDFIISPENGTALGFFFRHMKALGLGPDYFAGNPPLSKVAADLIGKPCRCEVGIRQWNEEDRNEVTKIMPPLAGAVSGPVTAAGPQPMAQPRAAQPQPTAQPMSKPQPAPAPQPAPQPVAAVPTPEPEPEPEPAVEEAKPADEMISNEVEGGKPAKPAMPF